MNKKITTILMLAVLALTLSCSGMIGKVHTSLVTVTVSSNTAVLDIRPATFAERAKRFLARTFSLPVVNAGIPAIVQDLRLTVSAADMTTITATVNVVGLDSADFLVDVPNGNNRHFLVEGLDSAATVQYSGDAYADLIGDPVLLTINMAAVSIGTTPDTTPPTVVSTNPASTATAVPIDTLVSAVFSEAMNTATITSATFQVKDGSGNPVAGSLLASGPAATFTPASPLAHSAQYAATITTGVKDLAGNAMAVDYAWSFTTAADAVPPTFAGLALVTNLSLTSMQLSWSPATDNVTPQANIVYLIYQATTPGGENFASPTYTTTPGTVSFTVTGLTPGSSYYFIVRARDAAGNIDSNTIELSQAQPGFFVATTGSDTNGTGSPVKPFRTITNAIASSATGTAIFIAAGTYGPAGAGPGETYPLALKPGSMLVCLGANHSSVISSPTATGIIGNANAIVMGCAVPVSNNGAVPAITDSGTSMAINNCLVSGSSGTTLVYLLGISLSGNSTVMNSTLTGIWGTQTNRVGDAILVSAGSPLISNNTITDGHNGINVTGGGPIIMNNSISGNAGFTSTGIALGASIGVVSVASNTFTGNDTGISVAGGSPTISGNTIAGSATAGIAISGGSPAITNNTINNNSTVGISVSGGSTTPTINNNFIYCNNPYDMITSNISAPINAKSNSWDHDASTSPTGPLAVSGGSTGPCPAPGPGQDICYISASFTQPDFSSFLTAVPAPPACR